jgi:cellulose synthase operon protein C
MRAYVAVEPQQLDKAAAAMDSLAKLYSNDPDGAAHFTNTLVGIAYELEQELDEMKRNGDTDKLNSTAQAFEKFLSKIAERENTLDYRTLNWIAATYESLAHGLAETGSDSPQSSPADITSTRIEKLSPEAKDDMQQAAKAYEAILSRAKDYADFAPADKLPAIQRRLALDYRSLGDFDKATAMFVEILKDKPTLLPVQIEAAYTYQLHGQSDPDYYVGAILGGRGPAQIIWGWNQIAQKTARNEHFRDVFHEARYNMALCRVEFSATRTNPEEKRKLLELAKGTIRETERYESTLGGEKWKPQYEKLLREIQTDLNQPVVGLMEFQQKEAEQAASESAKDQKK